MSELGNILAQAVMAVAEVAPVVKAVAEADKAVSTAKEPFAAKESYVGIPCTACQTPLTSPIPGRIGCEQCDASLSIEEFQELLTVRETIKEAEQHLKATVFKADPPPYETSSYFTGAVNPEVNPAPMVRNIHDAAKVLESIKEDLNKENKGYETYMDRISDAVQSFVNEGLRLEEPDPNVNLNETALKVVSCSQEFNRLRPLSTLLDFIQIEEATSTVLESTVGPNLRGTDFVRYTGVTASEGTNESEAIAKLILELDRQLFFGNGEQLEVDGLKSLAYRAEANGIKSVYRQSEYFEFSDRLKEAKKFYDMKLFQPNIAMPIGEGELPADSNVLFAVGRDAVKWSQLLNVMKMKLATLNPDLGNRYVYLIYGCLQIVDWDQLFIYVNE